MTTRLERFKNGGEEAVTYPEDVKRVREFIGEPLADLSDQQVEELWREYSDSSWSAGWVMVTEDTLVCFRFWINTEV